MATDEAGQEQKVTTSSGLPGKWGEGIQPRVSPRHMALSSHEVEKYPDELLKTPKERSRRI